jgi:hypothetical protein
MPLIKKLHPSRDMSERVIDATLQVKNPNSEREGKDSGYEDFGEFDEGDSLDSSDMEGSILHRPRPKKPTRAPALPQRSDKRTSRLLADVMKELQSLDGSQQKELEKPKVVEEKDPHEQYLSSEEDASLSDDYDDSLLDLDMEDNSEVQGEGRETTSRASSRRSQEDTARVVSFTFVKPQIINITINPNSASNSPTKEKAPSTDLPTPSPSPSPVQAKQIQRPSPLRRRSNSIRRMSISSIASLTHTSSFATAHSNASFTNLPPRKSSRFADLASLVTGNKSPKSHAFLNTDPFPTQQREQNENTQSDAEPTTPKTPTSMAASAFKKGLTRGLGRARKPSMQRISAVYNSANNSSKASLSLANSRASTSGERPSPEAIQTPTPEPEKKEDSKPSEPVRYEDIMKNVVRAPPPQPITTTTSSPRQRAASMFMARRKSIKH